MGVRGRPFEPGKSGNPAGRPKGACFYRETSQAPDQRGRAVVPLRHLDEVLRMASRARLRLAVPWD